MNANDTLCKAIQGRSASPFCFLCLKAAVPPPPSSSSASSMVPSVSDAVALAQLVQSVIGHFQDVDETLDGWAAGGALDALQKQLGAASAGAKAALAAPGVQESLARIQAILQEVDKDLQIIIAARNAAGRSKIKKWLHTLRSRNRVGKLKGRIDGLAVDIGIIKSAVDTHVAIKHLGATEKGNLTELLNDLEEQYNKHVVPAMDYMEQQQELMGDRWAEGIFLPPVMVDEATRNRILQYRRDTEVYWRKVQNAYKNETITDDYFNSQRRANLARKYRELVEPVDIANYYYKNKHTEGRHYADGISNETKDDNNARPGRYLLLQSQELRVLGKAESSLGKAHQLKALLGNTPWEEWVRQQQATCQQTGQAHAAISNSGTQ